jgi:NTP pyrophosphatase (non-canonical NTP hydrolase)
LRDANRGLYPIKNDMMKELGDCLWFVASIAKLYDVKLSDIARMNIDKLEGRKQRGTIGGSGDDR